MEARRFPGMMPKPKEGISPDVQLTRTSTSTLAWISATCTLIQLCFSYETRIYYIGNEKIKCHKNDVTVKFRKKNLHQILNEVSKHLLK
jgi:hypothetical protein